MDQERTGGGEVMKNHIETLKKYGKKTILKADLEDLFAVSSDESLFEIVSLLCDEQILYPIKGSKTNGNRLYPIHLKYKVSVPQESYEAELKEIDALHPLLLHNGYLRTKPEEYRKYRAWLQKLDRYLFARGGNEIPISRKERSFEIFDEEKALDNSSFCPFLERCGIDAEVLAYYDTPEYCFNDYIPERKARMTLLICENKDIWFNIRRMMFEEHARELFGTHIDGVVYGCGNKISGKGALTSYTRFIGSEVRYLYWGDIDRAGLNIFLSTARANPYMDLELFIPAYEEMLRLAQGRTIPDSADERERMDDYAGIYGRVRQELRASFERSIQENQRIPQEIITYAFLKNNMR